MHHLLIIGMHCTKSKRSDVNVYLKDFVSQAAFLTQRGSNIQGKHYNFQVKAIICDTPAHVFIKCIKGHIGFYAYERYTVRKISVDSRRVYSRNNCTLRTHDTFLARSDENYHKPGQVSPLLSVPHFDTVRAVLLDSMHLWFIGVMKALLQRWQGGNPLSRISVLLRQTLADILNVLELHILFEFQRESFDFMDLCAFVLPNLAEVQYLVAFFHRIFDLVRHPCALNLAVPHIVMKAFALF